MLNKSNKKIRESCTPAWDIKRRYWFRSLCSLRRSSSWHAFTMCCFSFAPDSFPSSANSKDCDSFICEYVNDYGFHGMEGGANWQIEVNTFIIATRVIIYHTWDAHLYNSRKSLALNLKHTVPLASLSRI